MKKIGDENIWIPQRADPYVYRHMDGSYYFTASLPEYNGIAIRRADTLCKLAAAPEILIWRKHVRGPMGRNCIIWMENGIFILLPGMQNESGISGRMYWNAVDRIH